MLGPFLAAISGPLAKRGAAALGFGVVSYVGIDVALTAILAQAKAAWTGAAADVLPYLAMSGANTALSIIAGALVARLALVTLKKMALL